MSHVSKHKSRIKNIDTFRKVCEDKDVDIRTGNHTISLYGSTKRACVASFKPEKWRYRIAVDDKGDMFYDNFGSQTGSMANLTDLLVDYEKETVLDGFYSQHFQGTHSEWIDEEAGELVLELEV